MKKLVLAMMLMVTLCLVGCKGSIGFNANLHAAPIEQAENRVTTFLYFGADWCHYCKVMKQTTFADKEVQKEIEKLRSFRYEGKTVAEQAVYKKYKVTALPTVMVGYYNNDKKWVEVDRYAGYVGPESFLKWLRKHTKKPS